jgi:hypothetical protein
VSLLDIHANLSYSAIAPIIGLEPFASHTLSAKCPYCGAFSWSVYQDSKNLEEWHYCSQCKVTGSIIAMAAERLELSEQEAIEFLAAKLNTPVDFETIKAFHAAQNRKADNLKIWQHSQQRILQPSQLELRYLKKLGYLAAVQLPKERLLSGPGSLFGLASPEFVESKLALPKYSLLRKHPAIAVPYFRTPTIIGGFDFITPKRLVHHYGWRGANPSIGGDLGFVGLQFVRHMHAEALVVTSMLANLMQLQVRHFTTSLKPLPMLGYKIPSKGREVKQWHALADKNLVIWEREPTARILKQAILVNANLSFVGPEKDRDKGREVKGARWRQWVRHSPAIDLWRRIVGNSRPYKEALSVWARSATSEQKLRLLKDAEMHDEETAKLVRSVVKPKVGNQVGRRVRVPIEVAHKRADGNYKSTIVVERDGCWYDSRGQLIMGGILRVEHLVVRPSGMKEYAGKLIVKGKEYPFIVETRKANIHWLREFALTNEAYLEERFFEKNAKGSTKINPFKAAIYMQPPEAVAGLETVGWDGSGFQFKKARLYAGNFEQNPDFKLPSTVPGPRQNYCRMRKEVQSALSKEGTEMEITWALATALCAQVSAPAAELDPIGIWILRDLDPFMQSLWNRFEIRIGDYTGWKHKWPRRLNGISRAMQVEETGFFAVNNNKRPRHSDLLVVEAMDKDLQPRLVTHSADKIALNYLRYFSTLKLEETDGWESWLKDTHSRMQEAFPFVATEAFKNSINRLSIS